MNCLNNIHLSSASYVFSSLQLPLATCTSTTDKLGEFKGCKGSSEVASDADTITDGSGVLEHSGSSQGPRMLEQLSRAMDDAAKENDYDIPYSIATTAFDKDDMKVEEPLYADIHDEPC